MIHTVAISQDVSARKQGEEALRAAHDTFRHLVDYSPFGIYVVDADFQLVQVSAGAQKVFENVRPLIGRDFAEVIHLIWPDPFASEVIGLFHHTLETGEPYHAPSTVERRQDIGKVESYDWKIERLTLPDGRFGAVCHFYDLSERQRYEATLNASEERLRLALDTMNGFIFDWNLETACVFRSQGLHKLVGYAPEEVPPTAEWWAGQMHPDDLKAPQEKISSLHATDSAYEEEYRVRHREGHYISVFEQGRVMRDTEGTMQRIIGTTLNVTEQKQAQREITDLNARLQRAVAESHHRIKNNLQMLSALVEMQMPDTEETIPVSYLRRIGQHILTMATLHDLLTLESKVATDQDVVSLSAALEKLVPLLQVTAGNRKICIRADEMRSTLKQVGSFVLLVNELVSNALKHGKGDVEVTLSLLPQKAEEGGHRIAQLEVCDDGPGFPTDFDPKKAANTGLELIESFVHWDLRGQTAYENREKGGGRVIVTFPLPEFS